MLHYFIMGGGRGTRFWPESTRSRPKQFMSISGTQTMLRKTIDRVESEVPKENIYIVGNIDHEQLIYSEYSDIKKENVISEPIGRNTAPCIGLACLYAIRKDAQAVISAVPADHLIKDEAEFQSVLSAAERLASSRDCIVTLGIKPDSPHTGYGYIRSADELDTGLQRQIFAVDAFVEKPDIATAEKYLSCGGYFWNSGMFVFKASYMLDLFSRFLPDIYSGLMKIKDVLGTEDEMSVITEVYKGFESVSIDYGIMEKADSVAVIPCDFGWNDVGSWSALDEIMEQDENGNVLPFSDSVVIDSSGNVIVGDCGLISLVGVKDHIIVKSGDKVMIAAKENEQDVKRIVSELEIKGLERYL